VFEVFFGYGIGGGLGKVCHFKNVRFLARTSKRTLYALVQHYELALTAFIAT
jgi:hypothetical protein